MAEKEYIERGAAINRLLSVAVTGDVFGMGVQFGVDHAIAVLNEAPAANVVEVVRCRDCILYEPNYLPGLRKNDNYGICTRYKFLTEEYSLRFETDFCSYGTRKETNHG